MTAHPPADGGHPHTGPGVDVRWFGRTRFDALPVTALRARGLTVEEGPGPAARVGVCLGARSLEPAWAWARRHRAPLALFIWDLPPWRLASGKPDPVVDLFGRLLVVPRPWHRISRRPAAMSRILYATRRAAALWVPSESTGALLGLYAGREPTRVPYCYDATRFLPDSTPRDPDLIVVISRLVSYKGHADLLRAVAGSTWSPRVRCIGRGECAEEIRALASELGVRCSVETEVDDPGVVDAYRTAGLVVCPSHFEGFGLTGIEALACHAQVVATDIPPHREFLGPAVRYYPAGDIARLAACMEEVRSSPPIPPPDLRELTPESAAARIHAALRPFLGEN